MPRILFVLLFAFLSSSLHLSVEAQESKPSDSSTEIRLQVPKTPAQVRRQVSQGMRQIESIVKEIEAKGHDPIFFVEAMDQILHETSVALAPLNLIWFFEKDSALKRYAEDELRCFDRWFIDRVFKRDEFYEWLQLALARADREDIQFRAATNKISQYFRFFHSHREDLEPDEWAEAIDRRTALYESLENLELQFLKNGDETKSFLIFKKKDLIGLPDYFLEQIQTDSGDYKVAVHTYWQYSLIMKTAKKASTRKKVQTAWFKRGDVANDLLLDDLLALRHRAAEEMGLESWIQYQNENHLLDSEKKIEEFILKSLKANAAAFKKEKDQLEALKRKRTKNPKAILYSWDVDFYTEDFIRTEIGVDSKQIQEFFPYERSLEILLSQFAETYRIRFEKDPSFSRWHESVSVYKVFDSENAEPLGRLMIDPYPREGKDNWFFSAALLDRKESANGQVSLPLNLVVANFPMPSKDRPSLLTMWDLQTLAHELGHALHGILTSIRYSVISGYNSEADFVETPSTLHEKWISDPGLLSRLAKHYKTGATLPDEEIAKLIEALQFGRAHELQRRAHLSLLDLKLHSAYHFKKSPEHLDRELRKKYWYPAPAESNPLASFTYIVGYDAIYWSYLMGHVLGDRLSEEVTKGGKSLFDPSEGLRLRREVISQGGVQLTAPLIKKYLGEDFDACKTALRLIQ